jgi:hypothetical protein
MNVGVLNKRLTALETSGPVIATLADYVMWCADGYDPAARWDPVFEKQMEELAKDITCTSDH